MERLSEIEKSKRTTGDLGMGIKWGALGRDGVNLGHDISRILGVHAER